MAAKGAPTPTGPWLSEAHVNEGRPQGVKSAPVEGT